MSRSDGYGVRPCRGTTGEGTWCEALTTLQAQAVDAKRDDGLPMSGDVRATQGYGFNDDGNPANLNAPTTGRPGAAACVDTVSGTAGVYNVTASATNLCALNVKAAF